MSLVRILAISLFLGINAMAAQPGSQIRLSEIPKISMPSVNMKRLEREDAYSKVLNEAPRFAYTHNVSIDTTNSGSWEMNSQESVWRLRIDSQKALSLNFGFTDFYLPKSASLMLYSADGKMTRGPFNASANNADRQLWTPVIFGQEVVLELRVANHERAQVALHLTAVNHDYKGFGRPKAAKQVKSGSCNLDVACVADQTEYDGIIRSVAVISKGGSRFCTGFMVNNVNNDKRPLFMTAYHCGIRSTAAASLVAYWNYNNSTCREANSSASGNRGDGPLAQFTSGAKLLVEGAASDFTLVEFNQAPKEEFGVHYAGWDASDVAPTAAIAVHHPNTDEKRISFENDATSITKYLKDEALADGTHIRINDWDIGTTEPGSSGSPLFDQNRRIVGQLHGGYAACGNDDADWYGRIAHSWKLGLNKHLDPNNTGHTFVDGID